LFRSRALLVLNGPSVAPCRTGVMNMASDPIKILIVDDDERVLIELERLLESEGYSTATAWGGREALALSEKSCFDLLLVDEHVSDVDGAALLAGLKRRQPRAFQLLMHTRAGEPTNSNPIGVCKWEHSEMKARIRSCLAA
jgi:two-component system, OmpR family, response regulator ArlR